MKELAFDFGKYENEQTMTVKEVALMLNVTDRTIRNYVSELFPDIVKNGIETKLNELQVTKIKLTIEKNPHLESSFQLPTTSLNKALLIKQAMQFQDEIIENLQKEIQLMTPKVESFNALMRSDQNMSITDCAKHFGLKPKLEVFPYLRSHYYLTSKDLPSVKAIEEKVLSIKETERNDRTIIKQAVVDVSSLDLWRIKIVPNIKKVVSL